MGTAPGTLLQAAPIEAVGTRGRLNPAATTRIEYVTTDSLGRLITATGAVFRPDVRSGRTIALAPSTQGVARHCDPSYSCSVGVNSFWHRPFDVIAAYEQPVINYFLALGCDVVITDYPRDPDLGWQMYCDHQAGAHALADAVRAARDLGVDDTSLGLWGFSQGGGTIAAMLEEPDYAPDVQAHAAVVGAPPVNLQAVLEHVDGAMASGVIAYTVAGLMVTSADIRTEVIANLSADGVRRLIDILTTCTLGTVMTSGWQDTTTMTISGQPMSTLTADLPAISAEIERRLLGRKTPQIPVRLWASRNDDMIPFDTVAFLADAWSSADLQWQVNELPHVPGRTAINHFVPYFTRLIDDVGWLLEHLPR